MKLVNSQQTKEIEEISERMGFGEDLMMEFAGFLSYQKAKEILSEFKKIVIVCGKGRNGGDGIVFGRWAKREKKDVFVFLTEKEIKDSLANKNLELAKQEDINIFYLFDEEEKFFLILKEADLFVDAIFGIGFKGKLNPDYQRLISNINKIKITKISLDIPSGIDERGKPSAVAIKADYTFTFILPKLCLFLEPAAEFVGKVIPIDIGIPQKIIQDLKSDYNLITKNFVKENFPKRGVYAHKYSCGVVLFVGGSFGMSGAVYLFALSAFKVGCGMVKLIIPSSISGILQNKIPEAIVIPAKEEDGKISFCKENIEVVLKEAESGDVICIGCGLRKGESQLEFAREIVKNIKKPIIIDGDGIAAFKGNLSFLGENVLITPHLGEFANLIQVNKEEIKNDKIKYAREISTKYGMIVLLKGKNTIISKGKDIWINPTGGSVLAKAGSGDVLSGVISSLKAQGLDLLNSALLGTYIHGLTGDICQKIYTLYSPLASDFANALSLAIKDVLGDCY